MNNRRQLNVTGLKTATGGKHPSAITSMTEGLDSGFRGKIRTRTLPDCHYVLCFFFFYFKRIELLLFLSLTVTSNAITESSEKNRRTVQKSVIFTSKQLFCQSQKRSKKGKSFFPQQMLCNVRATKRLFTNN